MKRTEKICHLRDILDLKPNMRIAIDDKVEKDENGSFIVNVGYMRVSTDKQVEKYGLDIQENDIVRYSRLSEFTNLVLFIDDGYTGTNMERPALQSVISYIDDFNSGRSNIKINTFIVARIDRLGRTLLGTLQFIQDYIVCKKDSKNSVKNNNAEDINFISVAENYCRVDKNNPQSKFLLMLFATLAEYDRDQIVEKLKRGRTSRVASGKWIGGGNVPYGYRYNRETGVLEIEPQEAEVVREIFRLYTEEKLAPAKIAERFGFASDSSIAQILRRKSLTGCLIWQDQEYKGQHEPIISLETWEKAQKELERRSAHRTDSHYMLSSLLECGECGGKMRYQKWGNGIKIVCYGTQRSNQKHKPHLVKDCNCRSERFWHEDVEEAVVSELFRLSYLGDPSYRKSAPELDPIEILQKDLANAKRKLGRLYDNFADSDGEDDVLKDKIADCKRRIAAITDQISEERKKATTSQKIENAKSILRTLEATWPGMTGKERQTVCQELIEKVIIYKDGAIDVHLKLKSYLIGKENA